MESPARKSEHLNQLAHILDDQLEVQPGQDRHDNPGEEGHPPGVCILPHDFLGGGEPDQGNHGYGQGHAEEDLGVDQEAVQGGFLPAEGDGADKDRDNGDDTGHKAAQPEWDPHADEALHDDLSGQGAGDGRVLSGGQQGHGEEGGEKS